MSGSKRISKIALLLVLVMAVLACGLPISSPSLPIGPGSGETQTMVALSTGAFNTAMAIFTQNAILTPPATQGPSDTPVPTAGPTFTLRPTSTSTATMYVIPTWTPSKVPTKTFTLTPSGTVSPYKCTLIDQSPSDGTSMSPGNDFDIHWVVKNTGSKDWLSANVDFKYLSGKDFAKHDSYDLPNNVKVGDSYEAVIDALAPLESGIYTMYWGVVEGSNVYCKFYLSIKVK